MCVASFPSQDRLCGRPWACHAHANVLQDLLPDHHQWLPLHLPQRRGVLPEPRHEHSHSAPACQFSLILWRSSSSTGSQVRLTFESAAAGVSICTLKRGNKSGWVKSVCCGHPSKLRNNIGKMPKPEMLRLNRALHDQPILGLLSKNWLYLVRWGYVIITKAPLWFFNKLMSVIFCHFHLEMGFLMWDIFVMLWCTHSSDILRNLTTCHRGIWE